MLALEREERARARGARVYATIDGYASTCDAYHRVQMDPDGEQIVRCMHDGGGEVRPRPRRDRLHQLPRHVDAAERRDRVALHAPGVRPLADRIPGSSTKSMIGHPQGASGAAGVVATALALSRGFLPPTINLTDPDPDCDLDFMPNEGRAAQPGGALQLPRVRIEEQRAGARAMPMDDVVIAGGGPAGALAAIDPRAAGLRVRVFDRARFPRPKLCGDTLNPGALAVLGRHLDIASLSRRAIPSTACCSPVRAA